MESQNKSLWNCVECVTRNFTFVAAQKWFLWEKVRGLSESGFRRGRKEPGEESLSQSRTSLVGSPGSRRT